jgi:magnesium transporter
METPASVAHNWQRFNFSPAHCSEVFGEEARRTSQTPESAEAKDVFWLNVHGLDDASAIRETCESLGLPLHAADDLLDTSQRPTVEEYPEGLYFALKSIERHRGSRVELEQIGFVLLEHGVWSVQEKPADLFGGVRDRLRAGKGVVRLRSADYLLYTLLDAVLVPYRSVLGRWEETVDRLEDDVLERPNRRILVVAQALKRDLAQLRRALIPLRDAVNALEKGQF